jgi:hypothetical protein
MRERSIDRGRRMAAADRHKAGSEIRTARLVLGRSVDAIAVECRMSPSQVRRIERGDLRSVNVEQLAVVGSAVGLDVRVHTYPGPDPMLDAPQNRLLERLRVRVHPKVTFHREVGLPIQGDQRAWDVVLGRLTGDESRLPVEAESRLLDFQAQTRRIMVKLRDSGFECVLIVVADTRANRAALASVASLLPSDFPVSARQLWSALREGRHPGGSAIVLV